MKIVIHMLVTLSIIGIISGGLLSEISGWAAPKIAAHRKAATEKAVFTVQPEAKNQQKVESVDFELYKVFDDQNNPIGYALPFEGNGFQGKIRLMVGVKNDLKEIVGLQVLEQVETPGLGTKVTEDDFLNKFVNLSSVPKILPVKVEPTSKPTNEVQTITGATISSKAVIAIVNAGMEKLRKVKAEGGEL